MRRGHNPYAKWFDRLNVVAAVKVTTVVHRMGQGNFSNVKGEGAGSINTESILTLIIGSILARTDRLVRFLAGGTKTRTQALLRQKGIGETISTEKRQEET